MKINHTCRLILAGLGSVLLAGIASDASALVMYNTYNQYASNIGTDEDSTLSPDGWTYPEFNEPRGPSYPWVGTNNGELPFGLSSDDVPFANWAVHLTNAGATETVSSQNAHDSYGIWADIDTTDAAWKQTATAYPGTIYSMDLGLIKSDVTQDVTLFLSNVNPNGWQNFGVSIYHGMDQMQSELKYVPTGLHCCDASGNLVPLYSPQITNLGEMRHYGYWNSGYQPGVNTAPAEKDNPFGSYIDYVTHGDQSIVTFTAEAGEVYAVLLGGYSGINMYSNYAGYSVSIETASTSPAAAVPLPAAAWLFGSALTLLGVCGRNQARRMKV